MKFADNDILTENDPVLKSRSVIDSTVSLINALNNITECSFSEIGELLGSIYKHSKDITEFSLNSSNAIRNEIFEGGIKALKDAVKAASDQINYSEEYLIKSRQILASVVLSMQSVDDSIVPFKRIVKHLRILGISTKIENARMELTDSGFDILADNVEALAISIAEKSQIIRKSTITLLDETDNVIDKIGNIYEKHLQIKTRILTGLDESLRILNDKIISNLNKSNEIAKSSENISQNIGSIVVALQFQDITRQQTCHVKEFLEIGKNNLDEYTHPDADKLNSSDQEVLNLACNTFRIQSAQLSHTSDELFSAVSEIRKGIHSLLNNVEIIYSETENIITGLSGENGNELNYINDGLKSISADLVHILRFNSDLGASIEPLIETITRLTGFMAEINELGSEIGLIAMNAGIKASHTGTDGAALGVLADEIRNLSVDAEENSKKTSDLLRNVQDTVKELNELFVYHKSFNSSKNYGYENIEDVIHTIRTGTLKYPEQLRQIKGSFQKMKDGLDHIILYLEKYESEVRQYCNSFGELDIAVKEIKSIPGFIYKEDNSNIEFMRGKYTMDSERNIFNNTAGMEEKESGINPSYLDDNVELF